MKKKRAVDILEEDKTPQYEMKLIRKRGGKWEELRSKRRTTSNTHYEEDLKKAADGKLYSLLHTHPRIEPDTYVSDKSALVDEEFKVRHKVIGVSGRLETDETAVNSLVYGIKHNSTLPSVQDIFNFLEEKNYEFMEIAQRDLITGKVAGYYFIKKTKNTPALPSYPIMYQNHPKEKDNKRSIEEWNANPEVRKVREYISSMRYSARMLPSPQYGRELSENNKIENQKVFDELTRELGLRVRYVPTKGYEYIKGYGFQKKESKRKEESRLERTVMTAVSLSVGVVILLFLSTHFLFNGYAINESGTYQQSIWYILALLVIFMLVYLEPLPVGNNF